MRITLNGIQVKDSPISVKKGDSLQVLSKESFDIAITGSDTDSAKDVSTYGFTFSQGASYNLQLASGLDGLKIGAGSNTIIVTTSGGMGPSGGDATTRSSSAEGRQCV